MSRFIAATSLRYLLPILTWGRKKARNPDLRNIPSKQLLKLIYQDVLNASSIRTRALIKDTQKLASASSRLQTLLP